MEHREHSVNYRLQKLQIVQLKWKNGAVPRVRLTGTFDREYSVSTMTIQLTFQRGHYTGHWVEGDAEHIKDITGFCPPGGSGSLRIFFDDKEVKHLHDVTEKTAETVFTDYVRPDIQGIAERIYSDLINKGITYQISLRDVMADHEVIQEDIVSIRDNIKSLMHRDGHDTSEIDEDIERS